MIDVNRDIELLVCQPSSSDTDFIQSDAQASPPGYLRPSFLRIFFFSFSSSIHQLLTTVLQARSLIPFSPSTGMISTINRHVHETFIFIIQANTHYPTKRSALCWNFYHASIHILNIFCLLETTILRSAIFAPPHHIGIVRTPHPLK